MSVEEEDSGVIEQTLFVCAAVHVYRIPPRPAAGGYRSGEWRVADELFNGRLRLVGVGDEEMEIRFEDGMNGELFALVPIRQGQRNLVVEPVTDSSRYFVVRVENPETKAHAFLGMGFEMRDVAFDFSAALEDHERRMARGSGMSSSETMSPEVAALHRPIADLQLKEGEMIRVDIKNKLGAPKKSEQKESTATPKILAPPPSQPKPKQEWATFD